MLAGLCLAACSGVASEFDAGNPGAVLSDPDPTSMLDPDMAGPTGDPDAPVDAGALADGGADSGAKVDGGTDAGIPLGPCASIQATGNADTNFTTIQNCLNTKAMAWLQGGTYPIRTGLHVPQGSSFRGLSTPRPLIVMQPQTGANVTNFMVTIDASKTLPASTPTLVSNLRFDGNNAIGNMDNAATFMVGGGSNARVENVEIFNNQQAPTQYTAAGLYFICLGCKNNVFTNSVIRNHYYGVIFRGGLTSADANVISQSEIREIRCDSVTFAGYGEALSNSISRTGWDCNNGPIPGGGFYSLDNPNGGKVIGNSIHDTCGHGLDFDRVSGFTIEKNRMYDPGYTWNGTRAYCARATAAFLLDVSDSTITANIFENNHRPSNGVTDPNKVYSATGAASLSDLPAGGKTIIAFVLAHSPFQPGQKAVHNTINRNTFLANCSAPEGCVGLGYFSSRGTGLAAGQWSAATTNYYTSNTPFGSNVGSVRCGANWYAGNSTCVSGSGPPCNVDDFQHSATAFHNDNCRNY